MQGKNCGNEVVAKDVSVSHPTANIAAAEQGQQSVVCLLIPAGEGPATSAIYRHILGIPGTTHLLMEPGLAEDSRRDWLSEVQNCTILPVLLPEQGMPLEKNHVYVVNPAFSLYYSNGHLSFRTEAPPAKNGGAVDHFLAMLAATLPDQHIVIPAEHLMEEYAGGLRVVRAQRGFILAISDESTPIQPGPTGADLILPAPQIASRLRLLLQNLETHKELAANSEQEQAELAHIYLQLVRNKGMDFARRQQPEILRRIRRRMLIHSVDTIEKYRQIVSDQAEEQALFEELRLSLSGFFLDATIEHALLNDILPRILEQHTLPVPLRVWIPCCCGGHEAYALAIFLLEYLREQKKELNVQIFATDLNKASSERSRAGVYDASELVGLSYQKKRRYFTTSPFGFQAGRQIKEMCVFATQNPFKDPPFSNIDVIIGFSAMRGLPTGSLDRLFKIFHYALRPNGHILSDDREAKSAPVELFDRLRLHPSVLAKKDKTEIIAPSYASVAFRTGEREANAVLLSGHVPPALLIDEQLRVVRFYGNIEPYIRYGQDKPSLLLLGMVRDELIFEFEPLLERSNREGGTVIKSGIQIGTGESARKISIEIAPLRPIREKWKLVIFRETTNTVVHPPETKTASRKVAQKNERILSLEKESADLRSLLVAATEDATKVQHNSQIVNEEMMASNEELQSVNEQLESVNRQLQSSNVELNSVNGDLHVRNQALELSMEYVRRIVTSLRQPIAVLQNDLRIQLANSSFCNLLGIAAAEMQGQSLYAIANGILDRDQLRDAFGRVLGRKSESANLELRLVTADGTEHVLAIDISRLPKAKNIRSGLILSLEDITVRSRADKFKDEFISVASHELKTPATSILAYSQLLARELSTHQDHEMAGFALKLNSQVSRLMRLTKDLLDVTAIGRGQAHFKKERVNIQKLIAETIDEVQVTTAVRLTSIEQPSPFFVIGDRDRLQQVLVNLLGNAIKYAPGTPEIIIRTEITGNIVNISIQDFGPGIPSESLPKIFSPYYQSDRRETGGYSGVGLGLYIAIEIVRHHGGEINVSSEVNKGSLFTVSLPAAL